MWQAVLRLPLPASSKARPSSSNVLCRYFRDYFLRVFRSFECARELIFCVSENRVLGDFIQVIGEKLLPGKVLSTVYVLCCILEDAG